MKTHPPSQNHLWRGLGLSLLLLIGLMACQTPEYETYPQTEILEFRIEPSENIQAGDTLYLTCRILDSLDTRFNFYWRGNYVNRGTNHNGAAKFLDGEIVEYRGVPLNWTGNGHTNRWIVPDCTGYFSCDMKIEVDNFDTEEYSVSGGGFILINGGDQ